MLFVRHGRTPTTGQVLPGRAKGLHLGDEGIAQAERAAERIAALGKRRVKAVYASPMERTKETAAPIAAALGHKVKIERGLIEADFGSWTGKKLIDLYKRPEWSQVQKYPSGFRFPEGESFVEMQQRMVGACHQEKRHEWVHCRHHERRVIRRNSGRAVFGRVQMHFDFVGLEHAVLRVDRHTFEF